MKFIRKLFGLISDLINDSKYGDMMNSLYIHENIPKTCGTRVRRR